MPIDAAVLDVDGTVATCPYDFDAMRAAVAEIAARWRADVDKLGVRGVIEQIDAVAQQLGEGGGAFRGEAEEAVSAIEVAAARNARLLPGAAEALAELRAQGVAVALITRNCRAASDLVLRGFDDYAVLLTRDDVPLAKPDPDHVLRALAAVGRGPENAVVVGDHGYDMQAGRAAGARLCVGVRSGNSPDSALLQAGADAVIESIAELPRWLRDRGELPK
ncbi:MAG: HAD family hydrolase [Armatimonadota bacterium]